MVKLRYGQDGIHIFNRETGLNILVDEVSPPPEIWSPAPRQVSVALTNRCDLACSYCYVKKSAAQLPSSSLFGWLDELDAGGCVGVGFGGGEPTLHPHFVNICRHASENTGLAVTFTTHGHRLSEQLAHDLEGAIHFIRISMDGIGKTYELLRGKSFGDLIKRFDVVRGISPFGINFVVNKTTFHDLDAATQLAAEVGAMEFLLIPEQPVDGSGGIDGSTSLALRNWVDSYTGSVPLSISEASADGMPICNPLPNEKGLRSYAHIDAYGTLKRSSYTSKGISIGSHGIMDALAKLKSGDGG